MPSESCVCPCCGAPLTYEGASGGLKCESCGNCFDEKALSALNAVQDGGEMRFEVVKSGFSAQEAEQMHGYTCKNCGAALMTERTTCATECPYCGNAAILPARMSGTRPSLAIPFAVSREQAQQQFHDYFKGKRLLPNVFLQGSNRIADMRKLYVPYYLFDCRAHASVAYDAQKRHVERRCEWETTRTEHYVARRSGSMAFENIPVDASANMDDKITESLEPYDISTAVPFQTAMLAGAMADCADVDSEECKRRAVERMTDSMLQAMRDTVSEYESATERARQVRAEEGSMTLAFMPVWLMTTVREGKTYTFAVNGQTGKLVCDVPADRTKSLVWGAGVFAGVMGVAALFMALTGSLSSGALLIAGVVALVAALAVLGVLNGQLRQAVKQSAAAEYARNDSFELHERFDDFLYMDVKRRKLADEKQDS